MLDSDNIPLKTMIDPPSGWRYGFPREFNPQWGETLEQWLVKVGYPEDMVEFAVKYSRMWWE